MIGQFIVLCLLNLKNVLFVRIQVKALNVLWFSGLMIADIRGCDLFMMIRNQEGGA